MATKDLDGLQRELVALENLVGTQFQPAIVSAAGTTQNDATALSDGRFFVVETVAAGAGVMVAPILNQIQIIYNAGGNPLNIWPLSGMMIGSGVQNFAVSLGVQRAFGIISTSLTQAYVVFDTSGFG